MYQTTTTTTTTATTTMDPSVDADSAHNGPNNTDSMVTVPLSDVQSNSDPSHPDHTPQTPLDDSPGTNGNTIPTPVDDHAAVPTMPSSAHNEVSPVEDAEDDVVDWAELEKTEEQEPRDEQSDEVCCQLDAFIS